MESFSVSICNACSSPRMDSVAFDTSSESATPVSRTSIASAKPSAPWLVVALAESIANERQRSSVISRQGPTGRSGGVQPGMRPSNVVRIQRNCWLLTRFVFHRGRGRLLFCDACAERNTIARVFGPCRMCSAGTRYRRNIFCVRKTGSPFSQISVSVARPSKQSAYESDPTSDSMPNVVSYHQSKSSMSMPG